MVQVRMLSDEWLSRYGFLENFNTSVTRTHTNTGTWMTRVTAIALCTSCSRAKNDFVIARSLRECCKPRATTSFFNTPLGT